MPNESNVFNAWKMSNPTDIDRLVGAIMGYVIVGGRMNTPVGLIEHNPSIGIEGPVLTHFLLGGKPAGYNDVASVIRQHHKDIWALDD